ncbi:UNVERIFIED_CONTAM: amidohydrolase family protein, partial [Williamsia faeni]
MSTNELPYPLFDADNHLYETQEALTKFLPEKYKNAIQYVQVNGRTKIAIRGQISDYIPNPTFDVVARPGAMEDYFKNGNPEGKSKREIFGKPIKAPAAFREPAARLKLMDELQIDRTLMFPTLASLIEERMRDNPELIHAVVHSLNQWLYETWGFNYEDRIFTVPVISLPIVEEAIKELEWCVERGAKAILVRPAPVPGFKGPRSFALPEFDPFWKRVVELDVLVTQHSSDSGYARYNQDWEGSSDEMLPFETNTFRMVSQWRPIQDTVVSWVCHGALFRFPELRIAVIENGASWLPHVLQMLGDVYKKAPEGFGMQDPVAAIKKSIHVSPFWEED